jgi:hypothetical protein
VNSTGLTQSFFPDGNSGCFTCGQIPHAIHARGHHAPKIAEAGVRGVSTPVVRFSRKKRQMSQIEAFSGRTFRIQIVQCWKVLSISDADVLIRPRRSPAERRAAFSI